VSPQINTSQRLLALLVGSLVLIGLTFTSARPGLAAAVTTEQRERVASEVNRVVRSVINKQKVPADVREELLKSSRALRDDPVVRRKFQQHLEHLAGRGEGMEQVVKYVRMYLPKELAEAVRNGRRTANLPWPLCLLFGCNEVPKVNPR
jgi:hypothetical protein